MNNERICYYIGVLAALTNSQVIWLMDINEAVIELSFNKVKKVLNLNSLRKIKILTNYRPLKSCFDGYSSFHVYKIETAFKSLYRKKIKNWVGLQPAVLSVMNNRRHLLAIFVNAAVFIPLRPSGTALCYRRMCTYIRTFVRREDATGRKTAWHRSASF